MIQGKIHHFFGELAALRYTPWYRWHPQLAMRYLPVVKYIKHCQKRPGLLEKGRAFSILEVGSGGLGITPYLKQPVTGVDISFDSPIHPLLRPVIGDAMKLKFQDHSFDVVVSMDMLEHVPKEKRGQAIVEMIRVAKAAIIIGVPCGKESQAHDRKIQDGYTRRHGKAFPFAEEHLRFGLPDEADILGYIRTASKRMEKNVTIKVKGNLNLRLREFLMSGWMSKNVLENIMFRKIFLLLIPLLRLIDRPPYYRKMFFVEVRSEYPNSSEYSE